MLLYKRSYLKFIVCILGIGPERAALLSISKDAKRRKRLARGILKKNSNGNAGGWVPPYSEKTYSTTQTEATMKEIKVYT